MGYDDVIPLIGDFGKYQTRIYFLLCLPAIICAFHKLDNVFILAEPKYRCRLPDDLPNATFALSPEQMSISYPKEEPGDKYSRCTMYNSSHDIITCESFVFDEEIYGYTAFIEWSLTCKKAYMIATGDSIFMFGVMVGSIVFGDLSDRFGRKPIFFISLVIQVIFGFLAAISPEFWTFTICRAIIGTTTSGVFLVAYVLAMEMVSAPKRLIAGTVCHMFFSIGYMLVALFAFYIYNWRILKMALTLPGLVFFSYWWYIPESSRWLITKGRITEAKKLICIAAKENKATVLDEDLNRLLNGNEEKDMIAKKTQNGTILDIFKHKKLCRRSLIIFFDWFANSSTYYGLSWNTNKLGGDPYVNFVISGAVEIPAYLFVIFTLNRWGRRPILCGCMLVAGVSLLLTMAIPEDQQWMEVTLAMLAKLAITASYGTIYIFSTEQFPTVIRNAGLGFGSTSARVGAICSPYINIMSNIWKPLPLIIYGATAFIGGLLSLCLPETLNKRLPETIEEWESFGKSNGDDDDLENNISLSSKK